MTAYYERGGRSVGALTSARLCVGGALPDPAEQTAVSAPQTGCSAASALLGKAHDGPRPRVGT